MTITWEDIVREYDADMIGGQLYIKHTLLGVKRGNQFDFTPEGEAVVAQMIAKKNKKFTPGLEDPKS